MPELVRHTKDQFLRLFESGKIQSEVAEFVSKMRDDPNKSEKRSWNNSYAFMDIVLRDDQIPSNIEVICECDLGGSRADMVLLSPADTSPKDRVAIVVELKLWDKYFPSELKWKRKEGKDVRDPSDPVAQAAMYMSYLKKRAEMFDVSTVMGCVYLHNITKKDYKKAFEKAFPPHAKGHDDVKVFYQGDTEKFRKFIRKAFEAGAYAPTRAIKRAKDEGYWPNSLPQTPGELRKKLLESGLARTVGDNESHYEPTPKGAELGIRRFDGYDALEKKPFVICVFTETAMRNVAEKLAEEQS